MSVITATTLNSILDNCVGYYLEILGTSGSGFGYGPRNAGWGAANKATLISTAITGSGDLSLQAQLANSGVTLVQITDGVTQAGRNLSQLLFAIQNNIIQAQVSQTVRNLDTYLTYLNTANPINYWASLQHPSWLALGASWFAGVNPSPWNIYADAPGSGPGAAYTNYLRQLIVGTGQTAGVTIDSTLYAGGFPALTVSGLTGTGTVTVTGTARDPANYSSVLTGKTWTANVTTNGTIALTPGGAAPAPTGSLILAVSGIVAAGGISAGTITAISQAPAGRPVEP